MVARPAGGVHRIRAGGTLDLNVISSQAVVLKASANVVYDDGTLDVLLIPERAAANTRITEGPAQGFVSQNRAKKDGWVYDGVVDAVSSVGRRGQTFCQLSIGPFSGGVLALGYLYSFHPVAQGMYDEPGPDSGSGFLRSIDLGDPAAGAEYAAVTVPTNAIWKLRGFAGTFVSDATAGNRIVTIRVRDTADVELAGSVAGSPQPASNTVSYHGSPGSPVAFVDASIYARANIALPDIPIPEDYDVFFLTRAIVAGDNWGDGQLFVEEWLTL